MAPPPTRNLAVSPCFHGCLSYFHRHFPPSAPHFHVPSICRSPVNSNPHPRIVPQSLCSSCQLLYLLGDLCLSPHSHIPSIFLSPVKSSPHPRIVPQSLCSICQLLDLLGDLHLWGVYGCGKDSLILIPFRLPQISCFTLSLKCFSSDPDSCSHVGFRELLQFSHTLRGSSVLSSVQSLLCPTI